MRASELLTTLSLNPKNEDYIGIYFMKKNVIPFTTIKIDQEGQLIFFSEKGKAPLSMKELLLTLMKNKRRQLLFWDGTTTKKIYGIREEDNKIVV
ncbi:hypothetical protein [Enterococcus songbeiensis]|uniref:hypothetical protein n=1 Tax=Enterococcus songbeiensis TaxID=2559927 RepID=UPI0010F86F74|nr:hypothetical protein [Enterococcus songbeiensis]